MPGYFTVYVDDNLHYMGESDARVRRIYTLKRGRRRFRAPTAASGA
jgi:hypothetical protein